MIEIANSTAAQLGRLIWGDVRQIWMHEEKDFTPWLAREENLSLLGQTLALNLALEAQEKYVGTFRADILAKDVNSGQWVLIENQLERTDHGHLGQLITYASGLKAVTVIWIAERFADEHRAALDWLNEITSNSIHFFGIELELWRIGDSPLAPKFNVISKPNSWAKGVSESTNFAGNEQRIRNILNDNPGLSDHKIAAMVGCSSSTANKWRKRIGQAA
jgi:hypothetical protein